MGKEIESDEVEVSLVFNIWVMVLCVSLFPAHSTGRFPSQFLCSWRTPRVRTARWPCCTSWRKSWRKSTRICWASWRRPFMWRKQLKVCVGGGGGRWVGGWASMLLRSSYFSPTGVLTFCIHGILVLQYYTYDVSVLAALLKIPVLNNKDRK